MVTRLGLVALLACAGCGIASKAQFAKSDLGHLPAGKIVLVGQFRFFHEGADLTPSTIIEVADGVGYQLSENGDVLWVVDAPPPGKPMRVRWVSSADDKLFWGDDGEILVPADFASAGCVHFGSVLLDVRASYKSKTQDGAVGVSLPGMRVTHTDDRKAFSRIGALNPSLAWAACKDAPPPIHPSGKDEEVP
jgi:hypothetical protein